MATNTVTGVLLCSDGTKIPLKTEIAEGTESNLTTDTVYSVSAQQVGDYSPGKSVIAGLVTADNSISYAYLLRQGLVESIIPVGVKGVADKTPMLTKGFTLQAGDKLRVLTLTASARNAALCVSTGQGIERIFTVTPSSGTTNELTDLQTSNSIGDTLQNQTIIRAQFTSVDAAKIETQGAYIVDSINNVVGSIPSNSPAQLQPLMAPAPSPVGLNFKAQFLTNA
jgi:hypothetical protein